MCSNSSGERSFSKLKQIKNELRSSVSQRRLNHLSLMSIESELLRKQNCCNLVQEIACKKTCEVIWSFSVEHGEKYWELFRIPEIMIVQASSFSHCLSTLFIWSVRVCYFAWWIRVLWGHHASLVLIEKMGHSKNCLSASPKNCAWKPCRALQVM